MAHEGKEISLPYEGSGSSGLGKPLKSIMHGNPNIPVMLGTSTPGNVRMTAEIADGWLSMPLTPESVKKRYVPLLDEASRNGPTARRWRISRSGLPCPCGLLRRQAGAGGVEAEHGPLFVGGMGAKGKNYHKDAMVHQGYADEAGSMNASARGGIRVSRL